MKKILLVTAALMLAGAAFSQSAIQFDNIVNASGTQGEFPGAIRAPIYNVSPTRPDVRVSGNTAAGVPMGSTTYDGALLNGTSFTATLWERNSANVTGTADLGQNNLTQIGLVTMRTATSAASAGRTATPANGNPLVADVRPGTTDRGTFQVRVWNNQNNTILDWATAVAAWAQGRTSIGYSDLFTVPWALTDPAAIGAASNLEGLRSFNMFTAPIPEPSVLALGVLGAGCLFLLRRRK